MRTNDLSRGLSPRDVMLLLEEMICGPDATPSGRLAWSLFVEGYRRGLDEGRLEGARQVLLLALEAVGFTVTEEQRTRITACGELRRLAGWLVRAVPCASVAAVLDDPIDVSWIEEVEERDRTVRSSLSDLQQFNHGRTTGLVRGRAEGAALMLLAMMGARGFTVTEELRDRISSCTDLARLEAWSIEAVTAARAPDVFAEVT